MICGQNNYFYPLICLKCFSKVQLCGRKCCDEHVETWFNKHKRSPWYVKYYHCKGPNGQDTECRGKLQLHKCLKTLSIISIIIGTYVFLMTRIMFGESYIVPDDAYACGVNEHPNNSTFTDHL